MKKTVLEREYGLKHELTPSERAKAYAKKALKGAVYTGVPVFKKLQDAYKAGFRAAQKQERAECAQRAESRYIDDLRGL